TGTTHLVSSSVGLASDLKALAATKQATAFRAAGNAAAAESAMAKAEAAMKFARPFTTVATGVSVVTDVSQAIDAFAKGEVYEGSQRTVQGAGSTLILTSIVAHGTKLAAVAGPAGMVIAAGAQTVDIGVKAYQICKISEETQQIKEEILASEK